MSARLEQQMRAGAKPDACSVAVLYDNAASRALARGRFDYLRDPQVAEEAAAAAAEADLIVASMHGSGDVPGEVQTWFEQWLPRRRAGGGLVLIQNGEMEREPDTSSYLRSIATQANLDFLPLASHGHAYAASDEFREDDVVPDAPANYEDPGYGYHSSGWGINE